MLFRMLVVVHVALSLGAVVAGLAVFRRLFLARPSRVWTALFLTTTLLTGVTGFLFPADHLTIAHVVGVLSLAALAIAIPALYRFRLAGPWRRLYFASALTAAYLNVFATIGEAFLRLPFLKTLAPSLSEAPFLAAQAAALALFLVFGILTERRALQHRSFGVSCFRDAASPRTQGPTYLCRGRLIDGSPLSRGNRSNYCETIGGGRGRDRSTEDYPSRSILSSRRASIS